MYSHNSEFPDRVYYNVVMSRNEKLDSYSYATYKDVSNQQILNDPSKYYLTILRFQMPTADIPILIPEIESYPNTDVNRTVYRVVLEWNGFTSGPIPVMYQTSTTIQYAQPRPITPNDPNPMKNPSDYYFIYNYRTFIDMVNNAYITAYNALNVASGGVLSAGPPFISYNGQTQLMTLHCPPAYLSSLASPIDIYMDYNLFTFFDGIEFLFNGYIIPKGIKIQVKDYNGTNFDGTHYLMAQQYPSLAVWNVFKSIQIVSSLLPVQPEIVPVPLYNDRNNYNTTPVIKDFVPFYENGPEFRSFINYTQDGTYELIDLNSNVPIKTIDIEVYWIDRYGNKYLLSIPYNQILTIKFAFIKKSTFTG